MKNGIITFIVFIVIAVNCYAQKDTITNNGLDEQSLIETTTLESMSEDFDYLSKLSPISPTAFQLLKYGEIPVNEYSGLPEISIPIYNIKSNDLELPINLIYHAGGIRVSEEAGWVGLGWNLSLGSIVQMTNDKDDFCSELGCPQMNLPDYYYTSTPDPPRLWDNSYLGGTNEFNFQSPYYSYWQFRAYQMPQDGQMKYFNSLFDFDMDDVEPDILKANFFGHSLVFLKDPKSENIIILNKKGYMVSKKSLNDEVTWEIVTPNGTTFRFENIIKFEKNNPAGQPTIITDSYDGYFSSSNIDLSNSTPGSTKIDDNGFHYDPYTNSKIWQITEIISPNGNSVTFHYESTGREKFDYSRQDSWYIFNYIDGTTAGTGQSIGPVRADTWQFGEWPEVSGDHISSKYIYLKSTFSVLDSITFRNGTILFDHSDRTDYLGDRKLDKITVYNNNNIVKEFDFNYNYFNSAYTGNGYCNTPKAYSELTQRLKLVSLDESGKPAYEFIYNEEYSLPPKNSYATDFWGFYNGETSNTSLLPNIYAIATTDPSFQTRLNKNANEKASVLDYAQSATLNTINYPTGGSIEFKYELNTFDNLTYYDITQGMGLRMKSYVTKTNGNPAENYEYIYEGGKLTVPFKFHQTYTDSYYRLQTTGYKGRYYNVLMTNSSNYYTPNILGNGTYVGYSDIKIYKKDNNNNYFGYVKKYFNNSPDIFPLSSSQHFLSLPSRMEGLENGILIKEEVWNESNWPVRIKENFYTPVNNTEYYYGIKHKMLGLYGDVNMLGGQWVLNNSERRDLVGFYPIYGLESILDSTKMTHYYNAGYVKKEDHYEYNSDHLVKRHYSTNSHNKTIDTYIDYPRDVDNIGDFTSSEKLIIQQLNSANSHQISRRIRERTFEQGSIIDYFFIPYKQYGSLILPQKINKKFGTEVSVENEFVDYDTRGNLLKTLGKNGIYTYYVWGYNGQYPVAKIESNNTNIDVVSIQNSINNLTLSGSDNKSQIDSDISNIKNAISSSVITANFVTVYTYEPLVGMTSQTDPAGRTTYYEYDDFGRLKLVRDQNGNIVSKNEYHYAGQ